MPLQRMVRSFSPEFIQPHSLKETTPSKRLMPTSPRDIITTLPTSRIHNSNIFTLILLVLYTNSSGSYHCSTNLHVDAAQKFSINKNVTPILPVDTN